MSHLQTIKFILTHPLTRDRKLDAVVRFAKWQIGSRLVPGPVVYTWVNGSRFFVRTGETGLTQNIYTGLQEFSDMSFLLHVLRPTDLFVDIGANVGSYTILAASAIGARGIAFEPVPSTFARLLNNTRLNNLDERVECINVGIGSAKGYLEFTKHADTTNHAIAPGEACDDSVRVDISSLDLTLSGKSPSVIKIDVEGYETPVLEGASETLRNEHLHSVIMELNGSGKRYGFDESRIVEMMLDNGFSPYSYKPLDRKLTLIEGKNIYSGNTLFIRHYDFVEERLQTAPKINVLGRSF